MTPWQRRLRWAFAAIGIGFAIVLVLALRQPKPQVTRPAGVERVDPKASVESTAGQILRLRGSQQDVVVDYQRLLTYDDGRQRLSGVKVTLPKRQGRDITVTADAAELIGADQSHITLTGHVVVEASDGLRMTAPDAVYDKGSGTVRTDGPVAFVRNRMSGHGLGMTYQEESQRIELHKDVVLRLEPEMPGGVALDITSGAMVFPRMEHQIRFDGGFRLVHGTQRLESLAATAFLAEDESRVLILELRERATMTGAGGAGGVRGMAADNMNLELGEDGRTLRRGTLSRHASIDVAAGADAARRIQGDAMAFELAADGATVTSLTAQDAVRLDLPASGTQPVRIVTANTLVAAGEAGKGLTSATFSGNTVFEEVKAASPGKPAGKRVARARSLDLRVTPGFGEVEQAVFTGAVRFDDGKTRASGGTARYHIKLGSLDVEGTDDSTGLMPRVADEAVTIDGRRIRLVMEGQHIQAERDVRSVMRAGGTPDHKRPSMLNGEQPVYATATALTYDGTSRMAVYDGGARLWQGDTAIQGERVTLDEKTGNLSATDKARATFMLEQRDTKTQRTDRVSTIGSGKDFVYEEAIRRATFTTDARLSGTQGDLRATKIELYLKPSGNELERVEAYEHVNLRAEERVVTGERLTYFAADERYVMVGAPVRIVADCRETVGRTLTFFKSVDTISVEGDEEVRTYTKGGSGCGSPRK